MSIVKSKLINLNHLKLYKIALYLNQESNTAKLLPAICIFK